MTKSNEIVTSIVKLKRFLYLLSSVSIMLLTLGMIITLILIVVGGCVLYKRKQRLRKCK